MNESFDAETILREVLEVLRRHNIPVETAALNVSMLDTAFDEQIPQLKTYKAGNFHRPIVIDDVPMLFHAQRRYPFDEIVELLEQEIRPPIEAFSELLRQEYPNLKIEFDSRSARRPSDGSPSLYLHSYRLGIDCQFSDDIHTDYNNLALSVFLQQREATEYPKLHTSVGWLVDEESGGEWGLDIVAESAIRSLDYTPHHIDLLQKELSRYFNSFRKEMTRKQSGDL